MPRIYADILRSREQTFVLPQPYPIPGYHSINSFLHSHQKEFTLTPSPISDHTRENTFDCDYVLVDGLIFIRSLTPDRPRTFVGGDLVHDKNALKWNLFEGLGIPFDNHRNSLLLPGEKIVEMSVASGILVAVSNEHRVFMYKPTVLSRPVYWEKILGAPDFVAVNELFLPAKRRSWAFSCSLREKELRRTDFINPCEIVSYFYDANGIAFDFGFTATIYVLLDDGQRIVYWDTGLPPSFSRGFLVPDGMQGQSISAAGSTVFLSALDAKGRLHFFTRMIDYEINGACPGLTVSYLDIPKVFPPEKSFPLGMGVRKMPLQGWIEHNTDLISPSLTHKIHIRLIGQGDESRELKIQGSHPELGQGYYFKRIFEQTWQFCTAPMKPAAQFAYDFDHTLPSPLKTYECLTTAIPRELTLELRAFHHFLTDSEPCYLVLQERNSTPHFIHMHVVDAWGIHYHTKGDEELVGSVDGEAKALVGTIVLTPEQIAIATTQCSPLGYFLKAYFLPYHGKSKAFRLTADNQIVIFHFNCEFRVIFARHLTEKDYESSFYMKAVMQPRLLVSPKNQQERQTLFMQNQECLQNIHTIFEKRKKENGKFDRVNATASTLLPVIGRFFSMYPGEDPTYLAAARDAEILFKTHRDVVEYSAARHKLMGGYQNAVATMERRMQTLSC